MELGLAAFTLGLGCLVRWQVVRAASASQVDHYYWLLVAEAYRNQKRLPVRLSDKYLLEDDEQAYPPFFGMLIGLLGIEKLGVKAVFLLELLQCICVIVIAGWLGADFDMALLAGGIFFVAPIWVVYNSQLNPRVLGDLFLFLLLSAEIVVFHFSPDWLWTFIAWAFISVMTAMVVMTHKMTFQLYVVLLPLFALAFQSWIPILLFLVGLILFVLIVGPKFAVYQFKAHWDIVTFWNRNWQGLGANLFKNSPLYGDASSCSSGLFHKRGGRGAFEYIRLVVSYAPFNLILPIASLISNSWPPAWLLLWLLGVYFWAFATLFVPRLKCLGGGHLYIFNAVVPGALYTLWLPNDYFTIVLYLCGIGLTLVSLLMALRIVKNRVVSRDANFEKVVESLNEFPASRVAVFPLQSAEAVAYQTKHSLLWGGHGFGFKNMEGFFPIMTKPLGHWLSSYKIRWLLIDGNYCPNIENIVESEMQAHLVMLKGNWFLYEVTDVRG